MSVIPFPLVRTERQQLLRAIEQGWYGGKRGDSRYWIFAPPVVAYVWVDGTCEIRTPDRIEVGYCPEFWDAIFDREQEK